MDDKWCKCFINVRQTIIQLIPGHAYLGDQSGPRITMIDEENQLRWVTQQLPGNINVPGLDFNGHQHDADIFSLVGVRFDLELEGDSIIDFGRDIQPTRIHFSNGPLVSR
jgi:hypothetical protein